MHLYQNMGSYSHTIIATNTKKEVSAVFDCEYSFLVDFDLFCQHIKCNFNILFLFYLLIVFSIDVTS